VHHVPFVLNALDYNAVIQRTDFHRFQASRP
jgi:hypothetical protein